MKILIVFLSILTITFSCKSRNNPYTKAINFKKMQYIHFESSVKMLHPESNLKSYYKFSNNKDFRKLDKFIANFKISYIKHKRISEDEMIVTLNVIKPDLSKTIPVMSPQNNLNELLNKKNLPTNSFSTTIHLKKFNKKWLILFKEK
jgi:hypothetical protein